MKTSCTCLLLTIYAIALASNSFAFQPETGAVEIISADQCDQATFSRCATPFFNNFGLSLPINEGQFLSALEGYVTSHLTAGVKNICTWLNQFNTCTPSACWTPDNFKSIGISSSTYFAAGFAGVESLCASNGINIVLEDAYGCVVQFLSNHQALQDCISGIDVNHIPDIPCTTIATALTCAVNILASNPSCPPAMDLAVCQAVVFGGDQLRPGCKPQLDAACKIASTAAPPQTTTTIANQQTTTTIVSQQSTTTIAGQPSPSPTTSSASGAAPTILLLLVVSAIKAFI